MNGSDLLKRATLPCVRFCYRQLSYFLIHHCRSVLVPPAIRWMTGLLFPHQMLRGISIPVGLHEESCGRAFPWFQPAVKNIQRAETHVRTPSLKQTSGLWRPRRLTLTSVFISVLLQADQNDIRWVLLLVSLEAAESRPCLKAGRIFYCLISKLEKDFTM